jgi:SDR family mycofactocin-dependent oxidoreductase
VVVSELEGQVALITGGARGQGRSHALTLAQAGADIVVCDIAAPVPSAGYAMASPDDLAETVALVEKLDRRCVSVQADVRQLADMRRVVETARAEFGRVDILLANAGIMRISPFAELTEQEWADTIDINLTGVANSIQAVLPTMIEQGYGRIVATSSAAGRSGRPNLSHYCASKWGVIGLVKSIATEVGGQGITVNTVCPTSVPTQLLLNDAAFAVFRPDLENPTVDDCLDAFASLHTLPVPWVEPQDVSEMILFLVGPRSKMITGSAFDIAAGLTAYNSA